jgi:predicted nucleotidyltransferase/uncharacterized protein (UPF0332 family)
MEFNIQKRGVSDTSKFEKEVIQLAREFSKRLYKEFGGFLKAVVLFGSQARKQKGRDIDMLVVVDDVSMVLGEEVVQAYRIIVEKAIARVSTRLHVTTLRLSSFWEYVRSADPIAINMLRDGVALIDTGFWDPVKFLLYQGRIRPTNESIWAYFMKAPNALHSSKGNIARAFLDLYWAVVDSAHAALMAVGEIPPTPEHVPTLLKEKLVKKKLVPASAPIVSKEFYTLMKRIEHREVKTISGKQYDVFLKKAEQFVEQMHKVVKDKKLQ